jgi:hypothetical protein
MWNQDSPVSVVSLHWVPRRDWSLWPRLRRASSRTITRPSWRQCENPTWSHTALLSQFMLAAGPPFSFTANIVGCWGEPWGEPVISLNSHHVSLVQWTTRLLPVRRVPGLIPRGVLMWNGDSPVSVVSQQPLNYAHMHSTVVNLNKGVTVVSWNLISIIDNNCPASDVYLWIKA